jgi:hypothetical protein
VLPQQHVVLIVNSIVHKQLVLHEQAVSDAAASVQQGLSLDSLPSIELPSIELPSIELPSIDLNSAWQGLTDKVTDATKGVTDLQGSAQSSVNQLRDSITKGNAPAYLALKCLLQLSSWLRIFVLQVLHCSAITLLSCDLN